MSTIDNAAAPSAKPMGASQKKGFLRTGIDGIKMAIRVITLRPVRERFRNINWEPFLVIWGPRAAWWLAGAMLLIAFARHSIVEPVVSRLGYGSEITTEAMLLLLLVITLVVYVLYQPIQVGQVLARNVVDSRGKARDDNRSRTPGVMLSFIFGFRLFITGVYYTTGTDLHVWWFIGWLNWPEWLVLIGLVIGNFNVIEIKSWAYTRISSRQLGLGDSGLTTGQAEHHAAAAAAEITPV